MDAVELRIDNWQAERARRARLLADEVLTLTAEASLADGLVKATVNHSGQPIGLTIKDRARDWTGERIAAAVLAAQAAPQQRLAQHIGEMSAHAVFHRGA